MWKSFGDMEILNKIILIIEIFLLYVGNLSIVFYNDFYYLSIFQYYVYCCNFYFLHENIIWHLEKMKKLYLEIKIISFNYKTKFISWMNIIYLLFKYYN
jgi:hypothetical protein